MFDKYEIYELEAMLWIISNQKEQMDMKDYPRVSQTINKFANDIKDAIKDKQFEENYTLGV